MQTTVQNKLYKFTHLNNNWIEKIKKNKQIHNNNGFEKYEVNIKDIDGILTISELGKMTKFEHEIVNESYQEYLQLIEKNDENFKNKDKWIYDIIDGIEEQDNVYYQDDQIMVVKNWEWVTNPSSKTLSVDDLWILTIPKDKSLRSIRSLDQSHIPLLEHCKNKTIEIISEKFNLNDELKIYFHYAPRTWHLHLHFVNVKNEKANSSLYCAHDIDDVIKNLRLDNNYYKSILKTRISKKVKNKSENFVNCANSMNVVKFKNGTNQTKKNFTNSFNLFCWFSWFSWFDRIGWHNWFKCLLYPKLQITN